MITEANKNLVAEKRRTARCKGCRFRKSTGSYIYCSHMLDTGRSRYELPDGTRVRYAEADPCPNYTPRRRKKEPEAAQ